MKRYMPISDEWWSLRRRTISNGRGAGYRAFPDEIPFVLYCILTYGFERWPSTRFSFVQPPNRPWRHDALLSMLSKPSFKKPALAQPRI